MTTVLIALGKEDVMGIASASRHLTTEELAELMRTTAETCRYWRHVGKGPKSFKVGRRVLYASEDVETFIAEARQSAVGSSAA